MRVLSLLLIALALSGCDGRPEASVVDMKGHVYKWKPTKKGHFVHDPHCAECQKLDREYAEKQNVFSST